MDAPFKIEQESVVNMTSKGQVLIPKALREANGLVPNGSVRVGINDRGQTVVLPLHEVPPETAEQRRVRMHTAIEAMAGSFSFPPGISTTDEYMRWLRGDWQP